MLEIDGLFYPQTVFDAMLNKVMEEVLQGIINRSKSPRRTVLRLKALRSTAVRDRVYREAMKRTKDSVPGLRPKEIDDSYTLLSRKTSQKSA